MKNKEKIKLVDFIDDAIKAFDLNKKDFKMSVVKHYKCPKCGRVYNKGDKFCSKDGEVIIKQPREISSDHRDSEINKFFYTAYNRCDKDFPYEHVEDVTLNGDGSGEDYYYIFKRKSDGKQFYYHSYDNRIEEEYLYETTKIIKPVWNFE